MKKAGVRIVVLQRGWVVVGRFSQEGSECLLTEASIVRRWGTTRGLGEIAEGGPTKSTVLDATPDLHFHELTIVLSIDCDEKAWTSKLR